MYLGVSEHVREECFTTNLGEEPESDGKDPHAGEHHDGVVHGSRIGVHIRGAGH